MGGSVRLEGSWDRSLLESTLPELAQQLQIVRLKGRVWLPGKALPLQVQMVGPRLDSWFEAAPEQVWSPAAGCGVDLVVLSFQANAAEAVRLQLQRVVKATPATASSAAPIPRG